MKYFVLLIILPILLLGAQNNLKPIAVGKKIKSFDVSRELFKITMDLETLKNSRNLKQKQAITIEVAKGKSLTFFPKRFKARKKNSDFTWVGESKDGKSKAILSVRNGVMVGTVSSWDGRYKILPYNNDYRVIKLDKSKLMPFHDDMKIEQKRKLMPLPELLKPQKKKNQLKKRKTDNKLRASEAKGSDSVITALLYYTQALKDKYGDTTEAMVQSSFDIARDSYIDSDTEINLQVTIIKQVPIDSLLSTATSYDTQDLLNKLQVDGLVRYEREVYGADSVSVFTADEGDNSSYCGIGSASNDPQSSLINAFSAVLIKPISEGGRFCSDFSYAHELGHNFGCYHDDDHSSGTPMYDYAFGYDLVNEFATIMSYDTPEIGFFSNPRMNYSNTDTGNTSQIGDEANADNARTIKENQFKMADNSEEISEDLEASDSEANYAIVGSLNTAIDRDGYIVGLGGSTTFSMDNNAYSNNPFYLNLYNESTHEFITSFDDDTKTLDLPNDSYRVTMAFSNDETGVYYNSLDSIDYTVDVVTDYVEPDERVAFDDTASVLEDSSVDIDVLLNDEENSHGKSLVASVTHSLHGVVANSGAGIIAYTPNQDYFGEDSFTYTNEDGFSATVTVSVEAVEDKTIAVNDAATTFENRAVDIDVLQNDIDVDKGLKAAVDSVTQGSNGVVSINADGTLKYTPNQDYLGDDSFNYTNADGNSASVTLTIQEGKPNITAIINYLLL